MGFRSVFALETYKSDWKDTVAAVRKRDIALVQGIRGNKLDLARHLADDFQR